MLNKIKIACKFFTIKYLNIITDAKIYTLFSSKIKLFFFAAENDGKGSDAAVDGKGAGAASAAAVADVFSSILCFYYYVIVLHFYAYY